MLKAVVGRPDSSGMAKVTVQSGPVIPDSFCIPVKSPHVSQMSAVQKDVKSLPVICDKRYHDEIGLENTKYDASEHLRHNVKAHKLADLRMVCSKYLRPLVNGVDRHCHVHKKKAKEKNIKN